MRGSDIFHHQENFLANIIERVKDITRAQIFLADEFYFNIDSTMKMARLIFLRAGIAEPCDFTWFMYHVLKGLMSEL